MARNPDNISDVRDALQLLGIQWRAEPALAKLNALAERSLFAARQMLGAFRLADTPQAFPQATFELWLQNLLQTAVEIQLFPDAMPPGSQSWEAVAAIWDECNEHVRRFHLTGIQSISEGDPWSIRSAVKAAWNIEFAAVGAVTKLGPISADSAHRATLRLSTELWYDFRVYGERVSDHPADRPRLWDAFAARWCPISIQDQCDEVRARLPGELASMRRLLSAGARSPANVPKGPANWSKPCSKTDASAFLGISVESLDAYLKEHPEAIKRVTRQKWQFDKNHALFSKMP